MLGELTTANVRTCTDDSRHAINLCSTPLTVRSVQNASSPRNQFQCKTNMTIIS